jgi:hypothetical protein
MAELSDAEVFGSTGGTSGGPAELSDAAVFGSPPPTAAQAVGRGIGLGTRNVIEGVLGGPYDLIARGINATGLLLPINTLGENLTSLGLPTPQTPFERGASAVIEPVAGTLAGQGVGRAMTTAASPVVQAVGKALTEQPAMQATAAGVGGATTAATGDPNLGLAASMITPFGATLAGMGGRAVENAALGGISKSDAELGRLALNKYDIPIGAPDLTDNTMIRIGADQAGKLPFSGARPAAEAKQAAWQGAIGKEMGDPGATSFTPDVMDRSATRIGSVFDNVAQRTSIPPAETTQLTQDLDGILHNAQRVLQPGEITPLETQINDLKALIAQGNGTIPGDAFQRLTNAKSVLSRLERQNSNTGDFAGDVRDALDDAFARSAAPADQDALQQARYQYRVMRTVDQLSAGSRTGDISPDAFMQKVLTASRKFDAPLGGMAYTGGGNIGELARIGKLMRAPPQTGTADRMLVNLIAAGGTGIPALVAHPASTLGVPAALAANRMAGAYLRSGSLANRLIENAIGPQVAQPNRLMQAFQTSGVTSLEALLQNQRQ